MGHTKEPKYDQFKGNKSRLVIRVGNNKLRVSKKWSWKLASEFQSSLHALSPVFLSNNVLCTRSILSKKKKMQHQLRICGNM